jgi:hypothetical protein
MECVPWLAVVCAKLQRRADAMMDWERTQNRSTGHKKKKEEGGGGFGGRHQLLEVRGAKHGPIRRDPPQVAAEEVLTAQQPVADPSGR